MTMHIPRRFLAPMTWTMLSFALAAVLILAASISARAQGIPMTCDQARSYLVDNGGSRTNVVIASRKIVGCGDMAPTTLVAAIRTATPGSVRDSMAQQAAWILSDRRLLDSVIVLSRSAQVTAARRTVALELLTHYADSLAALLPEALSDPMNIVIAHRIHGGYVTGSMPLTSADQVRALDAIDWIGRNESDSTVRTLAKRAHHQLSIRRAPEGARHTNELSRQGDSAHWCVFAYARIAARRGA